MKLNNWLNCNVISPVGTKYKLRFANLAVDNDNDICILPPRSSQPILKLKDIAEWEVVDVHFKQWLTNKFQNAETSLEADAYWEVLKYLGETENKLKVQRNGVKRI